MSLVFCVTAPAKIPKALWTAASMSESRLEPVPYKTFMQDDNGVKSLLESLLKYGIGVVSGSPADEQHTKEVVERVCFIQPTFFGRMWTFTANQARGDTAYTNIALGAHTDSTYLEIPAGIQACTVTFLTCIAISCLFCVQVDKIICRCFVL